MLLLLSLIWIDNIFYHRLRKVLFEALHDTINQIIEFLDLLVKHLLCYSRLLGGSCCLSWLTTLSIH